MPLSISPEITKDLSASIVTSLGRLSPEEQASFEADYNKQKKSTGPMLLLAILFPIQLILLGRTGLWVAYFLTFGGCGIWYIIEWFLTPSRVRSYNNEIASKILANLVASK